MNEELERDLHAWRDGELRGVAGWRMRRRIARDPALRRELAELDRLGELVRAAEAERPAPDLLVGLAATAFLLLQPGGGGGPSPGAGDIRSLDTHGHAVMVSSDERATIVWILDS